MVRSLLDFQYPGAQLNILRSPNTGPEQTRPGLDKTIAYLKKQGITRFAAVGYCFGSFMPSNRGNLS